MPSVTLLGKLSCVSDANHEGPPYRPSKGHLEMCVTVLGYFTDWEVRWHLVGRSWGYKLPIEGGTVSCVEEFSSPK